MIRRLVAATALLAVAAVLVLFTRDTWHWERAVHDADERAALAPISPAAWKADTALPASLARRLLGLDDDLSFRQASMQAIRAASHMPSTKTQKQRSILEASLARIARSDPDPARASRAADYLGVLLYSDPPSPDQAANPYGNSTQGGPSSQQTPEQKAMAQFLNAVRLDPADDNAQRNLERMLRQPLPPPRKGVPQPGGGEKFGHKGSGARSAGRGY